MEYLCTPIKSFFFLACLRKVQIEESSKNLEFSLRYANIIFVDAKNSKERNQQSFLFAYRSTPRSNTIVIDLFLFLGDEAL